METRPVSPHSPRTANVVTPAPGGDLCRAELARYIASPVGRKETSIVARKYLRSPEDCEDAVAEASLRAAAAAHQFDPSRRFPPWFLRILAMVCLETLRRRKTRIATCSLDNVVEGGGDGDALIYLDAIPDTHMTPVEDEAVNRAGARAQAPELRHAARGADAALSEEMLAAMRRLPRLHRDVLILLVIDEVPKEEVAHRLGMTVSRVAQVRDEGLARLRRSGAMQPPSLGGWKP